MHIMTRLRPLTEQNAMRTTDGSENMGERCSAFKPCFASLLSDHETQQFEKLVIVRRRVSRHASLYRKDYRFEMLYWVLFGQFQLIRDDVDAVQRMPQFHMEGDLMGLDAIAT
jgi:CRP/FNR family transcriptional regulator